MRISNAHIRGREVENSRAKLRRVAASPLAAVGGTRGETGVALAADLLVAVVF